MSRSAIKLHTPAGRKALDKMMHEAERRAQEQADPKSSKSSRPAAAGAGEVRIIGGQWRRTRLPVARQPGLRPTPDRVRETLFNWLGQDLGGWRCVDAFAGTGALGFEAASRGAASVFMNELDAGLAQQLQGLKTRLRAEQVQIVRGDAIGFLRQRAPLSVDLVLLDPPFGADALFEPALAATHACLAGGGLAYLEAPRQWSGEELAALGFALHRHMKAGAVHAHLLRKVESES